MRHRNELTANGRNGRGTRTFTPTRGGSTKIQETMGEGIHHFELIECKYEYGRKDTKLSKIKGRNKKTGVEQVFNIIDGSYESDAIMNALDPNGSEPIDFNDYKEHEFMIEVVKNSRGYENIVDAWAIEEDSEQGVNEDISDEIEEEDDDYSYEDDSESDLDIEELLSNEGI